MDGKLRLPIAGQPDPDTPTDVHLVGRYALGVTWADAHGSIYPFDKLRHDCPCGGCESLETLTPTNAWPQDIKKTPEGLRVVWADEHVSLYPYPRLRGACHCAGCTGGH